MCYNAFKHQKPIRVDQVTRATKAQIIRIYETLSKRNASAAFEELMSKAALYGTLLRPPEHFDVLLTRDLMELHRVGAASAYQILLFVLSLPQAQLQPGDFLVRAVNLLCRYHVRRNVTDTPATRDLDPAANEASPQQAAGYHKEGHCL